MNTFKNYIRYQLKPLAVRLGSVLLLYSIFRLLFYFANADFFPQISLKIFLHGIRFDLSAIVYTHAPYIVVFLLPFPFVYKRICQRIGNVYFIVVNSFAFLLGSGDIAYFPYVLKRSTSELFSYLNIGFDFGTLVPLFFKQFWYLLVLWIAVIVFLVLIAKRTTIRKDVALQKQGFSLSSLLVYFLFYCGILFTSVISMRGGFQLRPLTLVDTGKFAFVENAALVSNTPFSILFSIGKQVQMGKSYFASLEEAEQYISPVHRRIAARQGEQLPVKNVVVIILEGFSQYALSDTNEKEEGYQGFCPFLHGLSQKAIAFNGFASGRRTIEGVSAVFSGMPMLFNKSYVESSFSNNYFTSPVKILRDKGYNTVFFHGAENGSMNIENYCYTIGFASCFGKSEYPNQDDWDGAWGISDRSYLHYVAEKINTLRQPFFTGILTLSTHHPFYVPKDSKGLDLPQNVHPMMVCIHYADHALKEFFESVSSYPWYDSTLFIITADHTGSGSIPSNANRYVTYRIPLLFYHPLASSRNGTGEMMQQIDIMPSLFAYLGIDTPLFSYGRNVFDTTTSPCAVNYLSGIYQLFTPEFALQFDGEKTIALYPLPWTASEAENVMNDYPMIKQTMEQKLKALIDSYSIRMAQNKLHIDEHKKIVK